MYTVLEAEIDERHTAYTSNTHHTERDSAHAPKEAPVASKDGLALLLGPRQADIMRLIWTYGPATVRKLHEQLKRERGLAYNTVMTVCVRLCHKGLLERHQVQAADGHAQIGHPYIYAPRIGKDDFVRAAIDARLQALTLHFPALIGASAASAVRLRQPGATDRASIEQLLAYLGSLQDMDGRFADNMALDTIAALLERAEAAERKAAAWEDAARDAEQRLRAAEARLIRLERAREEALRAAQVVPYEMPTGVCRVCGAAAPPAHGSRMDGLRVCMERSCRAEARRRDSAAKQRRYLERRRALSRDRSAVP